MKKNEGLTQEELKAYLDYDKGTGIFRWIGHGSGRVNDGIAGSDSYGYIIITLLGNRMMAHRLAWLYMYGYFPENNIDHINRDTSDNRITNLREVTNQCNMRNSKLYSNNTSGVKGVHFRKIGNKWRARVKVDLKTKSIGEHENFEEAVLHRLAAEQCLDWEGCDSSSPAYQYYRKHIMAKTA